jgi:spermidine synthase
VLVVGLASGVTAGTALRDPRVERLVIAEIEPAVVAAEAFFRDVNGSPLTDPRSTLVVGDARAWLAAGEQRFDVIVSEPSNPWITGVSSLFTREYWTLVRSRLRPGGVVCQWVQTYGLGTDELRALLRTFRSVFPDAVVFESIEGADLLLVAGGDPARRGLAPIAPLLDADGLARAAGSGWENTDDRPLVEWRAPFYLHHDTSESNRALLHPD